MKKWRRLSKPKIIILASSIILVFLGINLTKEILNKKQINSEIYSLENEIDSLIRENEELSSFIEEWKSGNRLEREARLKLGLKKPGEEVIMIMREQDSEMEKLIDLNTKVVGRDVEPKILDTRSNLRKWWDYFFSNK